MSETEKSWKVSLTELFENDLVESGDIIAFRGTTWKEYLEKTDADQFYNVGIVYYPNKDTKTFFHLKKNKIDFNQLENISSFILIKSGIKWNSVCEYMIRSFITNPKFFKASKIVSILSIYYRNNPRSAKFSPASFIANFLNMNGYKISVLGITPTRLVELLINKLGRKVIEVYNG